MRVLITAGPTREPIDPVRFLSNHSTGGMGFALAEETLRRGHEALLVLGPVGDQPPVGAEVYGVETASEMLAAVLDFLERADAVICAAAVSDFRPARSHAHKLRRGELTTLELVENPDVAAEVGRRRGPRPLAIFALETAEDALASANRKLERKNADLCVLNSPAAIGSDRARFRIVQRDGTVSDLGEIAKAELARALLDRLGL